MENNTLISKQYHKVDTKPVIENELKQSELRERDELQYLAHLQKGICKRCDLVLSGYSMCEVDGNIILSKGKKAETDRIDIKEKMQDILGFEEDDIDMYKENDEKCLSFNSKKINTILNDIDKMDNFVQKTFLDNNNVLVFKKYSNIDGITYTIEDEPNEIDNVQSILKRLNINSEVKVEENFFSPNEISFDLNIENTIEIRKMTKKEKAIGSIPSKFKKNLLEFESDFTSEVKQQSNSSEKSKNSHEDGLGSLQKIGGKQAKKTYRKSNLIPQGVKKKKKEKNGEQLNKIDEVESQYEESRIQNQPSTAAKKTKNDLSREFQSEKK